MIEDTQWDVPAVPGIYGIHNLTDDRWYVGQSKNMYYRLNCDARGNHKSYYLDQDNHSRRNLYDDMRCHDKEFEIVILESYQDASFMNLKTLRRSLLNEAESYWISELNAYTKGYNGNVGGSSVGVIGCCKGKVYISNDSVTKYVRPELVDFYLSNGWRRGNNTSGMVFVNKDGTDKAIYVDELDEYLSNGWVRGRYSHSVQGKIRINNGSTCIYIDPSDLQTYLAKGWVIGLTKRTRRNNVKIRKDPVTLSIPRDQLDSYLSEGWIRVPRNRDYKKH